MAQLPTSTYPLQHLPPPRQQTRENYLEPLSDPYYLAEYYSVQAVQSQSRNKA